MENIIRIIKDDQGVTTPARKPDYSLDELLEQCDSTLMVLDKEDKNWLVNTSVGKEIL